MALLQISEPGQSTAPHRHNLACGIDLGTTNSLVASVMSGATKLLKDTDGEVILPSIALDDRGPSGSRKVRTPQRNGAG